MSSLPAPPRVRATAMPPEERRAAIVEVTLPLLLEHGSGVTTRQIAEAAGIAEGTIFRVFPDKDSLMEAVVEKAFDPAPVDEAVRAIDRTLPLEARLAEAVDILRWRVTTVWNVMTAAGLSRPPQSQTSNARRPNDLSAIAALFEPDRDRFRRDPMQAAQLVRGFVFAGTHPALIDEPLATDEIVSVLLHGILAEPEIETVPATADANGASTADLSTDLTDPGTR